MKGILNTPNMVYESSLIKLLFTIVIAKLYTFKYANSIPKVFGPQ
jgi:hypothetical protein